MKVVLSIIGVIIVLLLFGTMMGGIKDAQTDLRTDTFAVTTTSPDTTAAVVLVANLYGADILEVTAITSDVSTDNALPDSYVTNTKALTVRGLTTDDTRNLSVTYRYDSLTGDSAPASKFLSFLPIIIIISLVLIVVAGIIVAFNNR